MTRFAAVLMFAVVSGEMVPQAQSAEPLSAREVLDKSRAAMLQPVQYRVTNNNVETLISSKMQPDGSLWHRSEVISPVLSMVTLIVGKESYVWFPKTKLGMDTQLIHESMRKQATQVRENSDPKTPNSVVTFLPDVVKGNVAYFVVEEKYPDSMDSGLAKALPAGSPRPDAQKTVVEKTTFFPVEMTTSFKGSTTPTPDQTLAYSDIRINPSLANELFLPPSGYEFKKVKTVVEYTSYMMIASGVAQASKTAPPVVYPPTKKLGPITIDPKTGLSVAPVPDGMTRKQFDEVTHADRLVIPDSVSSVQPPPARSPAVNFVIAVLAGIVSFVVAALLLYYFRVVLPNRR